MIFIFLLAAFLFTRKMFYDIGLSLFAAYILRRDYKRAVRMEIDRICDKVMFYEEP